MTMHFLCMSECRTCGNKDRLLTPLTPPMHVDGQAFCDWLVPPSFCELPFWLVLLLLADKWCRLWRRKQQNIDSQILLFECFRFSSTLLPTIERNYLIFKVFKIKKSAQIEFMTPQKNKTNKNKNSVELLGKGYIWLKQGHLKIKTRLQSLSVDSRFLC